MEITFSTPALLFSRHQFIVTGLYQPVPGISQPDPQTST